MNAAKLKNLVSKKSKGDNTLSAQLYQMFFFERLLERIEKSKYKNNIILKGGLLLSSIIGEDLRTTKDMDATLKSIPLEKENVKEIMTDIIQISLDDNVNFKIIDIKDIRLEDEYGGFKIHLLGTMEHLKINMFVELTTGDVITPKEIDYQYPCMFEDKKIDILSYNIETVIAEKFETIISRGITNTRFKDFYDLYILLENFREKVNKQVLRVAIEKTFYKRNTTLDISEIKKIISLIENDLTMQKEWTKYQNKYSFAKEISFPAVINSIKSIINLFDN